MRTSTASKIISVLILTGLPAGFALAHQQGRPQAVKIAGQSSEKVTPTKKLMGGLLYQINALRKYSVDEKKFLDKNNQAAIQAHLKELAKLSQKASHDPVLDQENFRISRKILTSHVAETERVFRVGNKAYARWMLNSTQAVCLSCHTQLPSKSRELKDFELASNFSSPFEQAEYLFTTRAFDKASAIYDKLILEYPKSDADVSHIDTSLQRQVAYFSRVKQDKKLAIETLKRYDANKEIPHYVKKEIKPWIAQFEKWDSIANVDPKKVSEKEIIAIAKEHLPAGSPGSNSQESGVKSVVLLKVSGLIFQYMKTHEQSKITADLLYYLASYDRLINNNFFFSLANLYLRECMETFPADPIAQSCYKAFEEETILAYSGSGGTRVPLDVSQDLTALKKWVDSKGKMPGTQKSLTP